MMMIPSVTAVPPLPFILPTLRTTGLMLWISLMVCLETRLRFEVVFILHGLAGSGFCVTGFKSGRGMGMEKGKNTME